MIIIVQKTPKYGRLSVNAQIEKFQYLFFDENISFACQDCDISSDIQFMWIGIFGDSLFGGQYWQNHICSMGKTIRGVSSIVGRI